MQSFAKIAAFILDGYEVRLQKIGKSGKRNEVEVVYVWWLIYRTTL